MLKKNANMVNLDHDYYHFTTPTIVKRLAYRESDSFSYTG